MTDQEFTNTINNYLLEKGWVVTMNQTDGFPDDFEMKNLAFHYTQHQNTICDNDWVL